MSVIVGVSIAVFVVIAIAMTRCRHEWEERRLAISIVIRRLNRFHPVTRHGVTLHQKCGKCGKQKGWFVTPDGRTKLNPGYALSVIKGESDAD